MSGAWAAAGGLSAAAGPHTTYDYLEIDATTYADPYNLPRSAEISAAIMRTFGEDPDRSIFGAGRSRTGVYRLESASMDKYCGVTELRLDESTGPIASMMIKTEKVNLRADGSIHRENIRSPNDLLITLRDADKHILKDIPNEDILRAVLALDVGEIKKAVQRQYDNKEQKYTGHKYFVLQNVKPEDRNRIPDSFMFQHPVCGDVKMWISHKHQIRRCWFCGNNHAAGCPVRDKIELLKAEREQKKEELAGNFRVKTYSSSVFRYANQVALASDVDAMAGATTGNLLNAVEVDTSNVDVPHLILISGSNEKTMNVSLEEYTYSLKVIRQRLSGLVKEKKVILVPPPKTISISSEEEVKEEFFMDHLKKVEANGITVIENPIVEFDEDQGRHPSPEQTVEMIKTINKSMADEHQVQYLLESATDDVVCLPNKYQNVRSLYKYGCAACNRKEKNKWFNLCDDCKVEAVSDKETTGEAEKMRLEIQRRIELDLPALGLSDESEDEMRCEKCEVIFSDISEIRAHFQTDHPDSEFKFKRGKHHGPSDGMEDDKKGRRSKCLPSKSLPVSGVLNVVPNDVQ